MYFYDYALNGEMRLGNWHVLYKDDLFQIFYTGEKDKFSKSDKEFLLFSSVEIDKTATYKFVLYIISKMSDTVMEKTKLDNFKITDYELVVKE